MDFERQARRAKAQKLASYCREHTITATWVREMTATERAELCKLAGVNEASAETWAVVIGLLGAQESPAYQAAVSADDPFRGLPS